MSLVFCMRERIDRNDSYFIPVSSEISLVSSGLLASLSAFIIVCFSNDILVPG